LFDRIHDLLEHAVCIRKDVVVPETQDTETAFPQIGIADLITSAVGVLAAVRFDDEHLFE
jgi:hypothetical protein